MPDESAALTANQLVGYNLARIRKTLGLSQEEAAARLEPYLPGAKRWSKNVYSAAERSYDGKRVRHFTADDLVAMSLAFGVPVAYFLLPPRPEDRTGAAALYSGKAEVGWRALFDVMLDGPMHGTVFFRAMELPAGERPEANSRAGIMLGHLSSGRVLFGDESPGPLQPDDPRLRLAAPPEAGED
jgi:transcriptional regulator with XRE-family HTH domain